MKRIWITAFLFAFAAFAVDNAVNFGKSQLAIGITSADLNLTILSGHAARFPTAPFNIVVYNSTDYRDPSDAYWGSQAEIMRVTLVVGDTFTVTRAQEGTTARNFNVVGKTYTVIEPLTAKVINQDLQPSSAILTNFVNIGSGTSGDIIIRDASRWTNLAKSADGLVLKLNGGFPSWQVDLFGAPGSGDDVWVNHADIANPNFTNSTDILWIPSGTNLSAVLNGVYQPTNSALSALASNPTLYQATNAALTALSSNPNLYQATNGTLTRMAGIGGGTSGDVIIRDATGWTNLSKDIDGKVLKLASGFPSWQTDDTSAGGETVGTVHAPDGATIANRIALFKDTTGTNITQSPNVVQDFQSTNAILTVLAADTASGGAVKWHDGTRWTNSVNPFQSTNAALTALAATPAMYQATNGVLTTLAADTASGGAVKWHDGTRWTNLVNPFQATNANLTLLAAARPIKTLKLRGFDNVYALSMIPNTNNPALATFMKPVFADDAITNVNYVQWITVVPADLDTAIDLTATLKFRLMGADTGTHNYDIGFADIADSAAAAATPSTWINMSFAGDASGADGDLETVGPITLTGWKAGLTAGHGWLIRIERDGPGTNAADSSTVDSELVELIITYTNTL